MSARTTAKRAVPGSIAARIEALQGLLKMAMSCRCESCFELSEHARRRIAILERFV